MKLHIALNDIGPEGMELHVEDQAVWTEPCQEFHLPVEIVEDLVADVQVSSQEDGCLVRGTLRGKVKLPCDRCADPMLLDVRQSFDEFEAFPPSSFGKIGPDSDQEDSFDPLDTELIFMEKNGPVLDLGALLWEEFALALPVKPLCSPECKGICPQCGVNFNREHCDCFRDDGDPRMAALRELSKKNAAKGE